MKIRLLKASEIDCRIQSVMKARNNKIGCILLLYKDARVDMHILDETFGMMNWQRKHEGINGNLFCTIDVWDDEKKTWVSKEDVGTESYTEKEKGQASDSFKRAGFNWGIGRELYTAPFIYIDLYDGEYWDTGKKDDKGNAKYSSRAKFIVSDIDYNDKDEITRLRILDKKGNDRYTL